MTLPRPTPDAYATCIACNADYYPPSGTGLCSECCPTKPSK